MEGVEVTRTGCCEPFDATPWSGTRVHWSEKPFIRVDVRALWHVPVGLGKKVTHTMDAIRAAGAFTPGMLMIASSKSPWKTEVRFETTGPVPGYPFEKITGTFFARAFDGPWKETPHWHDAFRREAKSLEYEIGDVFEMWTTCPACAKAYGHNWVVLLGKIEGSRVRREGRQPL